MGYLGAIFDTSKSWTAFRTLSGKNAKMIHYLWCGEVQFLAILFLGKYPKVNLGKIQKMFSSVQFSRSVVSNSLRPHESQHARPPCLSPSTRVHSDSRPSSQWWHPAISSSVVPFSSCPQSLPASESFPMSQLSNAQNSPSQASAVHESWTSRCSSWM